ncbi:hypothetical protein NDU88_002114 [Pleurodeles waltl]|uniref:Uncharacterized protein n=1 Tax=Pleurodeles waltl TaxID=8319 RepID=A0AAV7UV87_PLEWA|nr:hypothetical protein NDU88_002114 [Pleurodeles waltl]
MAEKAEEGRADLSNSAMTDFTEHEEHEEQVETRDREVLVQCKINDPLAKVKGVEVEATVHFFSLSDRSDKSEEVKSESDTDLEAKDLGVGVSSGISENSELSNIALRAQLVSHGGFKRGKKKGMREGLDLKLDYDHGTPPLTCEAIGDSQGVQGAGTPTLELIYNTLMAQREELCIES